MASMCFIYRLYAARWCDSCLDSEDRGFESCRCIKNQIRFHHLSKMKWRNEIPLFVRFFPISVLWLICISEAARRSFRCPDPWPVFGASTFSRWDTRSCHISSGATIRQRRRSICKNSLLQMPRTEWSLANKVLKNETFLERKKQAPSKVWTKILWFLRTKPLELPWYLQRIPKLNCITLLLDHF